MLRSLIYLCREHVQVGEEQIHMATSNKELAERWKRSQRRRTKTRNFDVVECVDGERRGDL